MTHDAKIIDVATRRRLPAMFNQKPPVDAGGLVSHGPKYAEAFRGAALYVDGILRGAKPADPPSQQPTKFELVINMKTARAPGLAIRPALLVRADQVVE